MKQQITIMLTALPFPHFLNTPLNLYGHGLSGDQPQSHPRDSLVTVLPSDSTMAHSVNHGGLINNIFVINYCGNIIYDCNQRIVQNPEGYATLAADGTPTFHY